MPADARKITPADILPASEFNVQRKERRSGLLPMVAASHGDTIEVG